MTYTQEQLRAIIDDHGLWLRGAGGSRADLSRADLSGAYLSGAYLSGADLSGANLSGAYLSGAYLSGAYLSRAYLHAWAQIAFKGHGQSGRMLTAYVQAEGGDAVYQCGCFCGSRAELERYINEDTGQDGSGLDEYRASRTRAMEIVTELITA